jgi:hypothetical protein
VNALAYVTLPRRDDVVECTGAWYDALYSLLTPG